MGAEGLREPWIPTGPTQGARRFALGSQPLFPSNGIRLALVRGLNVLRWSWWPRDGGRGVSSGSSPAGQVSSDAWELGREQRQLSQGHIQTSIGMSSI